MMREINPAKLRNTALGPRTNMAMRYLKTSSMLWRSINGMAMGCGRMLLGWNLGLWKITKSSRIVDLRPPHLLITKSSEYI